MRIQNLIIPVICLFLLVSIASADPASTIVVNTNVANATFILSGVGNYLGAGQSWSRANVPAGSYTIVYSTVVGYVTPVPETQVLPEGGTITFNGNYAIPGATGTINVVTDLPSATFTLSGAGNYRGSASFWTQSNAPAGTYTVAFDAVAGYPTPQSQTLVLLPGGNITFNGSYGGIIPTGTGTINVSCDLAQVTFSLTGPTAYNGGGMFWSQTKAPTGTYMITFAPIFGYPTPASQTLVLTPSATITFTARYLPPSGTGTITVNTNLSAATFAVSGPSMYFGSGTFWSQSGCPAGIYTITFGSVSGYPTPAAQTLVLTGGGAISFSGAYGGVATAGTINVNTNVAGASFLLTGPTSYAGSGTSWLQANAPVGTYTISFSSLAGFVTPLPQTQTLVAGSSITFNAAYLPLTSSTGSIVVTTDRADATFTLSGPATYQGSGKVWLQTNAPPGIYTILFDPILGYTTPPSQMLVLNAGGTLTFSTNYGTPPTTGTIVVTTNLSGGSFIVSGPGFYQGSGMFWSQQNCPAGSYTITFLAFPGYPAPPSQTLILTSGKAITFTGNYGIGPNSGTISVTTNKTSASFVLSGAASFSGGGLLWNQVGAPSGLYTITYGGVAGYATPPSQTLMLAPGNTIAFSGMYVLLGPLDLPVIPSALSFVYDVGLALPGAQNLTVAPVGSPMVLTAYANTGTGWLSVLPSNAITPAVLAVSVNPSGLAAGTYSGSIRISATTDYRVATVPVTLTVRDAPKLILTPASMSFAFVTKGILPAAQDLWISAAPRNLSFSVSGTAGNWLAVTGTGNTPAKLSISVDPSKLNPGTYTGVFVVTSADASNSPQSVQVTLTVTGTAPQLGDSAVFNAAYRDARIAACSVASVYGTNLAQSEGTAQQVPLPFTLGSARVNVNGRPAPMFYASSGQINFQIPCDLTQGPAQVEVNNGIASAYTTVQLKATAPGVYLYENTWAVANNEDGSVHGDDNPAMPGSIVAVYFTGQGLLDGPIAAGDPAPLNRYLCPLAKASATINGQPVEILFVGLSPGSVGLAQVNVRIPDLPAGEYSLVLTVGGVPSNPAILCVKAKP